MRLEPNCRGGSAYRYIVKALRLRHKVIEVPVTIEYPKTDGIAYTKMRALVDWWKIFRPVLFLGLGLKK